jgi:hypothetical protein
MPPRRPHPTAPLIVRKTIKVGGETYEPGTSFDRALVSSRLLGRLFDQKKLGHAADEVGATDQGVSGGEVTVETGPAIDAGAVEIPDGWENLHLFTRLALARKLTKSPVKTSDEANLVIAGEVARRGELSGS